MGLGRGTRPGSVVLAETPSAAWLQQADVTEPRLASLCSANQPRGLSDWLSSVPCLFRKARACGGGRLQQMEGSQPGGGGGGGGGFRKLGFHVGGPRRGGVFSGPFLLSFILSTPPPLWPLQAGPASAITSLSL